MLCKILLFGHYFVPQIEDFTFEINFSQCSLEQSACPVTVWQTDMWTPHTQLHQGKNLSLQNQSVWPSALQRQLLYYSKEKKNEGRSME